MQNTLVGPREHWDELRSAFREFFNAPDDGLFNSVRNDLVVVSLKAGEVLVREDEPSDELFFVISGRLRAVRRRGQMRQVLGEIVRGETVGELGLITGEARSATVLAIRDTLVARMNKPTFRRILDGGSDIAIPVMRSIIDRFRRGEASRRAGRVTVSLVPVTAGLDLAGVAAALAAAIRGYDPKAVVITSADYAALPAESRGDPADQHGTTARWLDLAEVASATLVLVADATPSDWTRICLRRADEILLVADATKPPVVSEIETHLLDGESAAVRPAQSLVLVHPADRASPSGTAAWLDRRAVSRHIHVRPALERDMRRLARLVTGRGIGLVLSGGGARGLAHIGVVNALAEAGFAVDVIGGTSIGAAIGSLRALDLAGEALVAAARRIYVDHGGPTGDYNLLPLVSLLSGARTRRGMEEAFRSVAGGEIGIEDTWLTSFCVAGNYSTASEAILTRGSLARSVLASSAIPGALPPVIIEGHLYVDGSTVNNLPVDVMARYGVGRILAVDLLADRVRTVDLDHVPSPWALLADRVFRRGAQRRYKLPSLPEMLLKASAMQSTERQRELSLRADVCFRPPLHGVDLLDWSAFDRIVAGGYDSTVADLQVTDPAELAHYR